MKNANSNTSQTKTMHAVGERFTGMIKGMGTEAWEEFKTGIDKAWDEFKLGVERAKDSLLRGYDTSDRSNGSKTKKSRNKVREKEELI